MADGNMEDGARPFTAFIKETPPRPICQLLLSIVEEACFMMKCLTYMCENTLEKLEVAKGSLDADIFKAMNDVKMSSLAYQAASGLDIAIKEKELCTATWQLCRLFTQRASTLKYFFATRDDKAPNLVIFYEIMEMFKRLVIKRLTTTLEEETAIHAYLDEVFRREDRAVKDHSTLSLQLQTDRDERSKAFDDFKFAEHLYHDESQNEKNIALAAQRQLQQEFDALEADESKSFAQKEKKLSEELEQLRSQIDKMQEENRTLELTNRGKKEQSVEEVANLLDEYQEEIEKKKKEIQKLSAEHDEVHDKMVFYKQYYEQRAREEKQRQEEADAAALLNFRLNRYARMIQRKFRKYIKAKKAEETARKKKEAAAKKKKK